MRIEFMLADAQHDLVGDSVDVAIGTGQLSDSSIVARKIGDSASCLGGIADLPQDCRVHRSRPKYLIRHSIIMAPAGRGHEAWTFRKEGKVKTAGVGRLFRLRD
ncbi:hypothetical protein FJ958_22885 [Mesorhizobium sp. B2-3-5]|nr:hypothetical protein FJ958_22885 [Mesorhizobium sp. B2-3-5]